MTTIAARVVAGRYELRRLLGRGGMGEVWLAQDGLRDREVAVKLPRAGMAASSRELEAARRLAHPHIVPLVDSGWDGELVYLVFAYVEAPTLREVLDARGRLTAGEVIAVGAQIASVLAHAHASGVVHNDIKPGNIFLSERGALLADFGAAVGLETTLSPGRASELAGTVAYLAPEVLAGARPSIASDLYALALVLYEAAAGALPWQGAAGGDAAVHRLGSAPTSLRQSDASIPSRMDALLLQTLSPLPSARPPSAAAFAAALRPAAPTERLGPAAARARRRASAKHGAPGRWWLAGVALGCSLLLAGGGLATIQIASGGADARGVGGVPSPSAPSGGAATAAPATKAPAVSAPPPTTPTPTATVPRPGANPGGAAPLPTPARPPLRPSHGHGRSRD